VVWKEFRAGPARDYSKEIVASEELFEAYKELYRYENIPLNAEIELTDDEPEHWTIEKISFDAAYGGERMFCYLFLPRGVSPPYQTVVLFPGSYAIDMRSSKNGRDINSFGFIDFVIRSGRAALCPVYKSTYERGDGYSYYDSKFTESDLNAHVLLWWKDLSRSMDYIETRDDIDTERIAFMGSSWGAWMAPLFLAQDARYRTALLRLCGFATWELTPAFDPFHFAPRVKIPVLMINGRYDYLFPHETSQIPMFEILGTPSDHKRHVIFDAAHGVYGHRNEMIREVLDWLDKYLGPVEKANEDDLSIETSRGNTIEANS
jgi:dienelactone hydrolase